MGTFKHHNQQWTSLYTPHPRPDGSSSSSPSLTGPFPVAPSASTPTRLKVALTGRLLVSAGPASSSPCSLGSSAGSSSTCPSSSSSASGASPSTTATSLCRRASDQRLTSDEKFDLNTQD